MLEHSQIYILIPFLFCMKCTFFLTFSMIKWFWLKSNDCTKQELKLIFSTRKEMFSLKEILAHHSERKMRIIDGLSRKGYHFGHGIFLMLFSDFVISDPEVALISVRGSTLTMLLAMLLLYKSNSKAANMLYGAKQRIMDGKTSRLNVLSAMFCSAGQYIAMYLITSKTLFNSIPSDQVFVVGYFIYLPMTIGDALGEVIGSIWGKHKLPVWGIGEVNKKSIAGTVAVFFGSLLPLFLVIYLKDVSLIYVQLAFLVSIVTTFVELYAPRSTDSFFIPIVNVFVVLGWLWGVGMI
ncbi:MAG: hypothetical protein GY795_23645 [Desulfobacterales bacterium]|nr:hypothetical protein [Desulfobacterales bacterium]